MIPALTIINDCFRPKINHFSGVSTMCPFCLDAKTIPATVSGYGFPPKHIVSKSSRLDRNFCFWNALAYEQLHPGGRPETHRLARRVPNVAPSSRSEF
jgi:hypothetical protein